MWDAWLDLALGGRCAACERPGRVLCPGCAAALPVHAQAVRPDPAPDGLAPVFACGPYAAALRSLLVAHKERRVLGLAGPLGALLAASVETACGPRRDLLLIPVPSRPGAARERGHDPLGRLVRAACVRLEHRGSRARVGDLLRHHRDVGDQAGLDAAERARNLAGALRVDAAALGRLSGQRVTPVLCDDIVTTGATAREAQRALAAVGVEVAAVAVVAATRKRYAEGPGSG